MTKMPYFSRWLQGEPLLARFNQHLHYVRSKTAHKIDISYGLRLSKGNDSQNGFVWSFTVSKPIIAVEKSLPTWFVCLNNCVWRLHLYRRKYSQRSEKQQFQWRQTNKVWNFLIIRIQVALFVWNFKPINDRVLEMWAVCELSSIVDLCGTKHTMGNAIETYTCFVFTALPLAPRLLLLDTFSWQSIYCNLHAIKLKELINIWFNHGIWLLFSTMYYYYRLIKRHIL